MISMSNETITITHKDVVITYDERNDKWAHTLPGRDRSSKSLELARKAIDTPEEKPFEPFEACC